jgi:hypothetical protein
MTLCREIKKKTTLCQKEKPDTAFSVGSVGKRRFLVSSHVRHETMGAIWKSLHAYTPYTKPFREIGEKKGQSDD